MSSEDSSQQGHGKGFRPFRYIRDSLREDKEIAASVEKDFILGMGFGLTVAMRALLGIAIVGGVIGILVLVFAPDEAASIIKQDTISDKSTVHLALASWAACVAIAASIAYYFLYLLASLIGTVGRGDPFVPENVRRLWRMSWAALGVQILSLPIGLLTEYVEPLLSLQDATLGDVKFNLSGLLAVLVLFILTRVFERGVAMREDLEGTV